MNAKRRRVDFVADKEMTDAEALIHSRLKYNRAQKQQPSDDRDHADIDTRDEDGNSEQNQATSKHTLESDEEDEDKYQRLNIDRIEGQEDATTDYEGNTKITPFNMREEMDEGHFDTTGNFVFVKDKEQIKDAWLDEIDWSKVKENAGTQWQQQASNEDKEEEYDADLSDSERRSIYEQLMTMMRENETLNKTIRRLAGQGALSAAEERKRRWAEKRGPGHRAADTDRALKVTTLTGLVDRLVSNGDLEAYEMTYEKVAYELKKLIEKTPTKVVTAVDTELDIFGANIPKESNEADMTIDTTIVERCDKLESTSGNGDVQWEYKMKDSEEVTGPVSCETMVRLRESGQLEEGVVVRKVTADRRAPFYPVARIQFDLYL